jgi:GntR family transcriptional regulator
VIPFRLTFHPGVPVHEQATFAAKKAMLSGRLRPGESFPSVRALSKALKINPNTAHKVIAQLTHEGFLEVQPGIGTVVADRVPMTRHDRGHLLDRELDHLTVEAMRIGLTLEELKTAIEEHWRNLESEKQWVPL